MKSSNAQNRPQMGISATANFKKGFSAASTLHRKEAQKAYQTKAGHKPNTQLPLQLNPPPPQLTMKKTPGPILQSEKSSPLKLIDDAKASARHGELQIKSLDNSEISLFQDDIKDVAPILSARNSANLPIAPSWMIQERQTPGSSQKTMFGNLQVISSQIRKPSRMNLLQQKRSVEESGCSTISSFSNADNQQSSAMQSPLFPQERHAQIQIQNLDRTDSPIKQKKVHVD